MTVHVYNSSDTGAPVLNASAPGSLVGVLKACLCNGYGSGGSAKTPAGWTLTIDEVGSNHTILVRNVGSGRYWRIKDDGYIQTTDSSPTYAAATITGCQSYTDINTLIIPFPRTIAGSDLYSATYYGAPVAKGGTGTTSTKWICITDENTCYLLIDSANVWYTSYTNPGAFVMAFGDLKPLGTVTGNPKAFVQTTNFGLNAAYLGPWAGGVGDYSNNPVGYLEHTLYDSSNSTQFIQSGGLCMDNVSAMGGLGGSSTFDTNYLVLYPDPITGGMHLERFMLCDYPNSVARPLAYRYGWPSNAPDAIYDRFATYAGLYGCAHSVFAADGYYQICNHLDTVTDGTKSYLLFANANGTGVLAIDMTGPW